MTSWLSAIYGHVGGARLIGRPQRSAVRNLKRGWRVISVVELWLHEPSELSMTLDSTEQMWEATGQQPELTAAEMSLGCSVCLRYCFTVTELLVYECNTVSSQYGWYTVWSIHSTDSSRLQRALDRAGPRPLPAHAHYLKMADITDGPILNAILVTKS